MFFGIFCHFPRLDRLDEYADFSVILNYRNPLYQSTSAG